MLDSLFGSQLGTTAKFAIAFLLVLGLIGITALILKRFGGNRMPSSGGGRNRQPRLSVLDSAVVDAKRRLVLIRRDNSEHLLLIGGPTDVVVETNIVRTGAPGAQMERRPRGLPQQDMDALENALIESAHEEPAPARTPQPAPRMREQPAPRPQPRPQPQPESFDEIPMAPQLRPEPQPEPAAFSPPPPLPPRAVAHPSAAAPAPVPPPVPAPPPARSEPNYADMQLKMEAALRKPAAAPAPRAPEPRVQQPAPPRPAPPPMPQTRPMPASPAPAVAQPTAPMPPKQDAPNPFDSLEAEMASLLGQDKKR